MQKVLQDCAVDFDGALRRNAARVYRLVYARAHRKEDAEDLFQEVFVRRKNGNWYPCGSRARSVRILINYFSKKEGKHGTF